MARSDLPDIPTTLLNNDTDIIVGISVSVTVLLLTIVVLLVFMFLRKYSTEQLSLRTVGSGDRHTNESEMDNYAVTLDYEQIDNVDNINKGTKANDQLHVTRIADTDPNTDQSNSSCSGKHNSKYESIVEPNEIYTNTVTSEYEQLDNAEIDKSTKAYDLLHVKHVVDTDPTTIYSKTMISREEHNNYEPIEVINGVDNNTVSSQYEQLDNAETDTIVNVYDQLDVTDMMYTDRLPSTQRP
ncbi:Hypothetical predicted protein [Mytilus galloprovincialis]|uniref:Uncharacterized protein n=1 Tax=Mytilus galloprovincialis TaxID=29158 RepID=A0A8B6CQQ6_MYTGA|nr:Hypothetical predicted protein [Mytilus galloprovincialis]